ncbi:MAG: hypothetical protein ACYDCD_13255 [Candidatus Acidiferrales bacterium]
MRQILAASLVTILMFSVGDCFAESQGKPARVPSQGAIGHAVRDKSLPGIFVSVLPEVKAKSHIPVLLPSELPPPIATAKHAIVDTAEADKYGIALYYEREPDGGYLGFAAFFSAEGKPKFNPRELTDFEPVNLARHLHGFFRAVSCGGSCAPANLWWEKNGVLYVIQLEFSPDASDQSQEKAIVAVVDSAILGGPR